MFGRHRSKRASLGYSACLRKEVAPTSPLAGGGYSALFPGPGSRPSPARSFGCLYFAAAFSLLGREGDPRSAANGRGGAALPRQPLHISFLSATPHPAPHAEGGSHGSKRVGSAWQDPRHFLTPSPERGSFFFSILFKFKATAVAPPAPARTGCPLHGSAPTRL